MANKQEIQAVLDRLGILIDPVFVPLSKSRNADKDKKYPTLNYKIKVMIRGRQAMEIDYSMGCAHCPGYKADLSYLGALSDCYREQLRIRLAAWECEHGKRGWFTHADFGQIRPAKNSTPVLPDRADVMYCLAQDAYVLDHPTFESWAVDYGYDPDSRSGEAIYRECLSQALALRAAVGDEGLRLLQEAYQDY